MSLKQRLLNTSALNLVDFAIKIIVVFLVSPFLIHRLGKPDYGLWMLLLSVLGYLDLLDLGFNQTSVRCLSQAIATHDPLRIAAVFQHFRRIYRRAAIASLLLTATTVLLLPHWVTDPETLNQSRLVLGIGGLLTSISYFLRVQTSLIKSHILYHKLILAGMARLLVNTTLTIAFLLAGYGLESLAIAWAIGLMLEQSLIWLQARPLVPKTLPQPSLALPEQKEIRGFAAKMTLWSMASFMRERVDTQVLGSHLGSIAVAHYAVGSRLVTLFSDLINAVFGAHFLAAFSQLNEQHGPSGAASRLLSSLRLSAPFALSGGICLFLLGPAFIDRWLGPGFEQSHLVIQILAFPLSLTLMQYPTGTFLGALNRHGSMALVSVIGGALNLVGSLLLVQWIGFQGVVIATAIELLLTGLIAWPLIVSRHQDVSLRSYLLVLAKPIAVLTPVALAAIWFQSSFGTPTSYPSLLASGLGLTSLLAIITWTTLLTPDERSWIKSKRRQAPKSTAS